MTIWSAPQSNPDHTVKAQKERQSAARIEDANASTRPNQTTVNELRGRRDK